MSETLSPPKYDNKTGLNVFAGDLRSRVFKTVEEAGDYFEVSHSTISRRENPDPKKAIHPDPGYLAELTNLLGEKYQDKEEENPEAAEEYKKTLLEEINKAMEQYPEQSPFRDWDELKQFAKGGKKYKQLQEMREEYLNEISNDFKDLDLFRIAPPPGVKTDKSLSLTQGFIELEIWKGRPQSEKFSLEWPGIATGDKELSDREWYKEQRQLREHYGNDNKQTEKKLLKISDILEHKLFVILGDVGVGKSTLLRYIAYAMANEDYSLLGDKARGKLPIFINIVLFANKLDSDPTLQVEQYIRQYHYPKYEPLFDDGLENENCIILLDGLDEVMNSRLRGDVGKILKGVINSKDQNRYMVTSRRTGYQSTLFKDISHGFVSELTKKQIKDLAEVWYQGLKSDMYTYSEDKASQFMNVLDKTPHIMKLASNPLLLTAILLMHYQGVELPNERITIYEYLTKTLVTSWPKRQRDLGVDEMEIVKVLSSVAFRLIERSGNNLATENLIRNWFEEALIKDCGYQQPKASLRADKMLNTVEEHCGILRSYGSTNGRKVYGFSHQIFTEYFAALHMQQKWQYKNKKTLQKYMHRERWQEVIKLMVANAGLNDTVTATKMLRQIRKLKSNYESKLYRNLLFAGECLGDHLWVDYNLADDIIAQLIELLKTNVLDLRWTAANVLKGLQGAHNRFQQKAIELLKPFIDNETEINVKWMAADILVALSQYDYTRKFFLSLIENPTEFYSIRALSFFLEKEQPEDKVNRLKQLIQRTECEIAFRLGSQIDLENTTGWYIDDNDPIKLLQYLTKEDLKELAIAAKKYACSPFWQEQGEWIHGQLSDNQSLEKLKRMANDSQDWLIRCQAAKLLVKRAETRDTSVKILKNVAEENPDSIRLVSETLLDIEKKEEKLATKVLRRAVRIYGLEHQISAIEQLAKLDISELVIPMVLELYFRGDMNETNQWRIIKALSDVCPDENLTIQMWLEIAQQKEHEHRYGAAISLLETNKEAAITTLRDMVNRETEKDRQKAISALIYLGENLKILYEDLKKMLKQRHHPSEKYWLTYYLSRLELEIEANGSSSTQSHETESTKDSLGEPKSQQDLFAIAQAKLEELTNEDPNNVDAWLAKAQILKLQGKMKDALVALNKIEKRASGDDLINLHAGFLYIELDENNGGNRALNLLNNLMKSTKDANICILAASILTEWSKKDTPALSVLKRAIRLKPKNPQAWINIGRIYKKWEKETEALSALENAKHLSKDNLNAWFAIANTYNDWGQTSEAQNALETAINIDSMSPKTWIRGAKTLINWHQKEQTYEYIQHTKNLDSKAPKNWITIAELLYECQPNSDVKDEIVKTLEKATDLAPQWVDIWFHKAEILRKIERFDAALYAYHRVSDLNPNIELLIHLGDIYKSQGHNSDDDYREKCYQQAIVFYTKAKDLAPQYSVIWCKIGDIYYYWQEKDEEAEEAYLTTIELDPSDDYAWIGLGDIYYRQQDNEQAIVYFNKAIKCTHHNYGYIFRRLCIAHLREENCEQASIAIENLPKFDPTNDEHWIRLGRCYREFGCYQQAINAFEEAEKLNPDNGDIYEERGNTYTAQGYYNHALKFYNQAIERSENDQKCAQVWFSKGEVNSFLGNDKAAKKAYETVLELDPNGNQYSLGCVYLLLRRDLRDLDKAKKELIKETNKSSPNSYVSYVNLGCVYYLLGNKPKAKSCFKKALRRCIANDGIFNDLAYAWLLVISGNPKIGQKELQSILSKMESSPGLLSALIRDTEILLNLEKPLPGLVDMHQLLINKKVACESDL